MRPQRQRAALVAVAMGGVRPQQVRDVLLVDLQEAAAARVLHVQAALLPLLRLDHL